MSALATPVNIQSHSTALAEGLSYGDRIHLGVVGNHQTDNANFVRFMFGGRGIIISVHGTSTELAWGDIVELWLLDEKPNIYHSDVPEVAEKLRQLKLAVQACASDNNGSAVLYLLDQVIAVKKAEPLFKDARKIIADVRF